MRIISLCFLMCFGVAGCANSGGLEKAPREIEIVQLYASSICSGQAQSSGVILIEEPQAYALLEQSLAGRFLNDAGRRLPVVDFNQDIVLVLTMGQQISSGYTLELSHEPIHFRGDTLLLSVLWREPASEMMTAQILTSPCLVLQLGRGLYRKIKVIDQDGHVRGLVGEL